MNIDNEDIEEKLEERKKFERLQYQDDLKKILSTPEGVRVFRDFFVRGQMFTTTFTGNSRSYFNEGRRNFALEIFAEVTNVAPEKVAELIIKEKEND